MSMNSATRCDIVWRIALWEGHRNGKRGADVELVGGGMVEVNVDVWVEVEVNVDDVDTPSLVLVDVLEGIGELLARPPSS
eukprot:3895620-Amphidinium_carterae.2